MFNTVVIGDPLFLGKSRVGNSEGQGEVFTVEVVSTPYVFLVCIAPYGQVVPARASPTLSHCPTGNKGWSRYRYQNGRRRPANGWGRRPISLLYVQSNPLHPKVP